MMRPWPALMMSADPPADPCSKRGQGARARMREGGYVAGYTVLPPTVATASPSLFTTYTLLATVLEGER